MSDVVIENLDEPMVTNRAFVAFAVEAGIIPVIKSLVTLAMDRRNLAIALKTALWNDNEPLSRAINIRSLEAILEYMASIGDSIMMSDDLPTLLNKTVPTNTSAGRDGGASTQVNISYQVPSADGDLTYQAEIYLDSVFQKLSTATPSGGWYSDSITGVSSSAHLVRLLYRRSDGAITGFGNIVTIPSA